MTLKVNLILFISHSLRYLMCLHFMRLQFIKCEVLLKLASSSTSVFIHLVIIGIFTVLYVHLFETSQDFISLGVWLPAGRRPLRWELESVAPAPLAGGTCRVPRPPGSAGEPGTGRCPAPDCRGSPRCWKPLGAPVLRSYSAGCTPASPGTLGSGGPAGGNWT